MSNFSAQFEVFSPRWGHADYYRITFSPKEMHISNGSNTFSAICKLVENCDPEWSGYNSRSGNPLMNIFSNDSIRVPAIVPFAMEWAWKQWREGNIDEDVIKTGLEELFEWINQTAKSKPCSELWRGAF